jgi:hypothetical protein
MRPNFIILLNFLIFCSLSCQEQKQFPTFIHPDNQKIRYEGRVKVKDTVAEIYWPGSQIEVNFKGDRLRAILQDTKGKNYYNVILDNDSSWILQPDTVLAEYTLADSLEDKEHNLKIYKRTEWNRGTTLFYGFKLDKGDELLNTPARKKRKMEFYGNSITAGYAIEDTTGKDRSGGTFTNNYKTYAAITARYFDAECHYIARSGIGVMASFVPQIMPEIYNRINPYDGNTLWNFNLYQPDIVVVNLLQNDSWLVKLPQRPEYKKRFSREDVINEDYIIASYARFIETLRDKYPAANIICMLGNMSITKEGSPWPGYVTRAVHSINDSKVYTFFVPFKNSGGHPGIAEQQELANKLIRFIERNIDW